MRPIKNRIFCVECQRPKILFESKSKALNFIKYNSDEIKEENGIAPIRTYWCKSCGGWHVTSIMRSVSERRQIRNLIGKAYRLLGEKYWASSRRFLCYATDKLRIVNERLLPSPVDATLKSEISKAKKKLDNVANKHKEKLSMLGPASLFKYSDLDYNSLELEVVGKCDDIENNGIVYSVRPKLLAQHNGKYYYVICTCRLNTDEIRINNRINGLDETDDSIQTFLCHSLNMVEIQHSFNEDHKTQYETISDLFEGEVLETWIFGMQLRVVERIKKSCKYVYNQRSNYDYWIKIAGRNIHFYLGRPFKYTCLVSTKPLNASNVFHLYKNLKEKSIPNMLCLCDSSNT